MIKLPEYLFVTKKSEERVPTWEHDKSWEEQTRIITTLGFLHPHEPSRITDATRKATQMQWAYHKSPYDKNPDIILTKYVRNPEGLNGRVDYPCPSHLLPEVWENIPLQGFCVVRAVSRSSTSNKVWRILDPRGVEFEISTSCFEDILMNTTVVNGVIHGECAWKSNKNLVLV